MHYTGQGCASKNENDHVFLPSLGIRALNLQNSHTDPYCYLEVFRGIHKNKVEKLLFQ